MPQTREHLDICGAARAAARAGGAHQDRPGRRRAARAGHRRRARRPAGDLPRGRAHRALLDPPGHRARRAAGGARPRHRRSAARVRRRTGPAADRSGVHGQGLRHGGHRHRGRRALPGRRRGGGAAGRGARPRCVRWRCTAPSARRGAGRASAPPSTCPVSPRAAAGARGARWCGAGEIEVSTCVDVELTWLPICPAPLRAAHAAAVPRAHHPGDAPRCRCSARRPGAARDDARSCACTWGSRSRCCPATASCCAAFAPCPATAPPWAVAGWCASGSRRGGAGIAGPSIWPPAWPRRSPTSGSSWRWRPPARWAAARRRWSRGPGFGPATSIAPCRPWLRRGPGGGAGPVPGQVIGGRRSPI